MIIEYHRPTSIEEALQLLAREEPRTVPLAGGSVLNQPASEKVAAVDLQDLGLNRLEKRGSTVELGATLTLQQLLDAPASVDGLAQVIRHEATYNLRQVASVAGTLVAADGRSPFATALLALDAGLTLLPGPESVTLGDLLPLRRERLRGRLITQVTLPLNARFAYHYAARSPADRPLVCAAAAVWPSGRTRVALGGFGSAPVLALDGTGPDGAAAAAENAYSQAGDEWASAEYRQEIAGVLVRRCLQELELPVT